MADKAHISALALLTLLFLTGCHHDAPVAPAHVLTPVNVSAAEAEPAGAVGTTRYTGSVAAETQVPLAFKDGGYVAEILQVKDRSGNTRGVQAGDSVKAGTVLASLQTGDYSTRVQQAEAGEAQAQAGVSAAQGQLSQALALEAQALGALTEARAGRQAGVAQLASARAARVGAAQQIAAAKIGLQAAVQQRDEAQAGLTKAQQDFGRADALYQSESLTKTDYDAAKANRDAFQARFGQADSQVQAAQNKIEQAETQRDAADTQVRAAQAQVTVRSSEVTQGEARVEAARGGIDAARAQVRAAQAVSTGAGAQVAAARIPLSDTLLRAPIDGVILLRKVEVGSLVGPGTLGFVVADIRRVKVNLGVPSLQIKALRLGQPVRISADVLGQTRLTGHITALAPAADPQTRVFDVEVTAPNPEKRLKVGMIATLELPAARDNGDDGSGGESGGTLVPLAALIAARPNGYAVFVVTQEGAGAIAHRRTVRIGSVFGNQVAVHGVRPGEQVVTTGMTLLRDGDAVRIVTQPEGGADDTAAR